MVEKFDGHMRDCSIAGGVEDMEWETASDEESVTFSASPDRTEERYNQHQSYLQPTQECPLPVNTQALNSNIVHYQNNQNFWPAQQYIVNTASVDNTVQPNHVNAMYDRTTYVSYEPKIISPDSYDFAHQNCPRLPTQPQNQVEKQTYVHPPHHSIHYLERTPSEDNSRAHVLLNHSAPAIRSERPEVQANNLIPSEHVLKNNKELHHISQKQVNRVGNPNDKRERHHSRSSSIRNEPEPIYYWPDSVYKKKKIFEDILSTSNMGFSHFLKINGKNILKCWQKEIIPRSTVNPSSHSTFSDNAQNEVEKNALESLHSRLHTVSDGIKNRTTACFSDKEMTMIRELNANTTSLTSTLTQSSADIEVNSTSRKMSKEPQVVCSSNSDVDSPPVTSRVSSVAESFPSIADTVDRVTKSASPVIQSNHALLGISSPKEGISEQHDILSLPNNSDQPQKAVSVPLERSKKQTDTISPHPTPRITVDTLMKQRCRSFLHKKRCKKGAACRYLHRWPKDDDVYCIYFNNCSRPALGCWYRHSEEDIKRKQNLDNCTDLAEGHTQDENDPAYHQSVGALLTRFRNSSAKPLSSRSIHHDTQHPLPTSQHHTDQMKHTELNKDSNASFRNLATANFVQKSQTASCPRNLQHAHPSESNSLPMKLLVQKELSNSAAPEIPLMPPEPPILDKNSNVTDSLAQESPSNSLTNGNNSGSCVQTLQHRKWNDRKKELVKPPKEINVTDKIKTSQPKRITAPTKKRDGNKACSNDNCQSPFIPKTTHETRSERGSVAVKPKTTNESGTDRGSVALMFKTVNESGAGSDSVAFKPKTVNETGTGTGAVAFKPKPVNETGTGTDAVAFKSKPANDTCTVTGAVAFKSKTKNGTGIERDSMASKYKTTKCNKTDIERGSVSVKFKATSEAVTEIGSEANKSRTTNETDAKVGSVAIKVKTTNETYASLPIPQKLAVSSASFALSNSVSKKFEASLSKNKQNRRRSSKEDTEVTTTATSTNKLSQKLVELSSAVYSESERNKSVSKPSKTVSSELTGKEETNAPESGKIPKIRILLPKAKEINCKDLSSEKTQTSTVKRDRQGIAVQHKENSKHNNEQNEREVDRKKKKKSESDRQKDKKRKINDLMDRQNEFVEDDNFIKHNKTDYSTTKKDKLDKIHRKEKDKKKKNSKKIELFKNDKKEKKNSSSPKYNCRVTLPLKIHLKKSFSKADENKDEGNRKRKRSTSEENETPVENKEIGKKEALKSRDKTKEETHRSTHKRKSKHRRDSDKKLPVDINRSKVDKALKLHLHCDKKQKWHQLHHVDDSDTDSNGGNNMILEESGGPKLPETLNKVTKVEARESRSQSPVDLNSNEDLVNAEVMKKNDSVTSIYQENELQCKDNKKKGASKTLLKNGESPQSIHNDKDSQFTKSLKEKVVSATTKNSKDNQMNSTSESKDERRNHKSKSSESRSKSKNKKTKSKKNPVVIDIEDSNSDDECKIVGVESREKNTSTLSCNIKTEHIAAESTNAVHRKPESRSVMKKEAYQGEKTIKKSALPVADALSYGLSHKKGLTETEYFEEIVVKEEECIVSENVEVEIKSEMIDMETTESTENPETQLISEFTVRETSGIDNEDDDGEEMEEEEQENTITDNIKSEEKQRLENLEKLSKDLIQPYQRYGMAGKASSDTYTEFYQTLQNNFHMDVWKDEQYSKSYNWEVNMRRALIFLHKDKLNFTVDEYTQDIEEHMENCSLNEFATHLSNYVSV